MTVLVSAFRLRLHSGHLQSPDFSPPAWSFREAAVCHPAQGGSVARLLVSTPGLKISACALPRLPRLCAPCTVGRMSRNPAYFGIFGGVLGRSAVVVDAARSGGVCAGVGGFILWFGGSKVGFCVSCLAVLCHDGAWPPWL